MKYDVHVHIGFFKNKNTTFYFNPGDVLKELKSTGITHAVVMSTTQNAGLNVFDKVIQEFKLIENIGVKIYPSLWCLPKMLDNFSLYLSKYNWKALKIHPLSQAWNDYSVEQVFSYAKQYHLPIIIHTGFSKRTKCQRFEKIIKKYNDVSVILAHGQPNEYALEMLKKYSNCYIDTAFISSAQLISILKCGYHNKVLYGSDFPVQYTYPSTKELLRELDYNRMLINNNSVNENSFLKIFDHAGSII